MSGETATVSVQGVLHALADDTRIEMIRRLAEATDDVPCAALYEDHVPKSTASYHFRLLRQAGVISQYERGTQRLNHLERDVLESAAAGLLDVVLEAAERERRATARSQPRRST